MTDNGLAALAAALHHYRGTCELWTIPEAACPIDHRVDAAAILGERGVFLPEGLGPVMVGMAKEIAALRVALEDMVDDFVDELPELPDDHIIEWETTLGALRRAALADAKGTP